jgi:hypothetical protein
MNFNTYLQIFNSILNQDEQVAPYDDPHYLHYTKLNFSRQERWLKTGILNKALSKHIAEISSRQFWTVITEPWCGGAAHTLPFIHKLSLINELITIDYRLRDTSPLIIDQYLTNGRKSIPKLIISDKKGNDLAIWGPRPLACQEIYNRLLQNDVHPDQIKIALQKWYNQDKGASFQSELLTLLLHL